MTLIDEYRARPARYDNIDGSTELGFGLTLLGCVVVGIALAKLPEGSAWTSGLKGALLQNTLMLSAVGLGWWSSRLTRGRTRGSVQVM